MIRSSAVATVQPMRRHLLLIALVILAAATLAEAITIFPVDRATILAGARFDVKVEFDRVIAAGEARVTLDGVEIGAAVGRPGRFVAKEDGVEASAWLVRDASVTQPG